MSTTHEAAWSGAVRLSSGGRVFETTSGRAAIDRPMQTSTRFQAGSVSKAVLAITALHLVERGVLDLSTPIAEWDPALPARTARLTLHQLLTHTSGLGHWRDLADIDVADPPERRELLRRVLDSPSPRPVGTFSYSGFGYLLAAAVIERATSRAYARTASDAVLVPAGMTRSSSGVFPVDETDCAVGHHEGTELTISPTPTSIPGTGDLWTTTEDLIRLNQALHAGRLLRPELVARMTDPLVTFDETAVGDERLVTSGYGYGTWVGRMQGVPAAIHPGDNVGYRSLLVHLHGRDADVAILTNDDGPTLEQPIDLALAAL